MAPVALTIGNFDGVHLGHVALVRACADAVTVRAGQSAARAGPTASRAGKVIVLAFDPHPSVLLRPAHAPARLTSFDERAALLVAAGASEVVRLTPTPELLDQSAEDFLAGVLSRFEPAFIAEGEDFRFGKGRAGTVATMAKLAASRGCTVQVVAPVEVTLNDHTIVRASSSLVRWLLTHGRVADAARLLGRPYEFIGTVQQGDRIGRTIHIPTANVVSDCLMPMNGAYAGVGTLPDGTRLPAAINVGMRPTVNGLQRRVEVHLLRPPQEQWGPLPNLPEYGWTLRVAFHHFLRDEMKFPGLPALLGQIHRDIARVGQLVAAPAVALSPANA
ncbi:MAG TPA: bifunctional riboflavin kinase/FMN adenylyltransferase [Phycisphaerales bacterium]|nr:bifunctional riboflavin kinase/FMN adenylyltransferase [Phycisphaerales bacterium]